MSKEKNFSLIFVPSATVFISSFCIMVLELVASRLIARHLGSSLYTWTAVIGVILAGITIGNYLGGRIADKFPARKSIALLFAVCSITCVATIVLNNIAGKWVWLWLLNWPSHVFVHVCMVFLIPSTLLGTISPVVAKTALDRGLPTGRTIGDIYAWSAAGSIAGTFAAGYCLIAAMGTAAVIWSIGIVSLLMSILYWCRFVPLYIWAVIFTALMTMAMIPAEWAKNAGSSVALRQQPDAKILYEDESCYSHIVVEQASDNPDKRSFYQDKLKQCKIMMNDIFDLQYFYTEIYAAVTNSLGRDKDRLSAMFIGGGGYVIPRYIEKIWPGSKIDVAEIDPAVTRAAIAAFGLAKDAGINTFNMDARNYIDRLLEQKRRGRSILQYDFIYGDAFNDFSVPFQLVTHEFNRKISEILNDDGVYMLNVVDIFDSGLFAGACLKTLEETFPCIYVVTETENHSARNTFVIIASKNKLDLKNIISQYKGGKLKPWHLDDSDISTLKQKAQQLILTDDYCPADNLLAPVVRDDAKTILAEKFTNQAEKLKEKGQFTESIENYLSAAQAHHSFYVQSYNEIAVLYARMGNLQKSAEIFNKALQYERQSSHKITASIHYSLGMVLKGMGQTEKSTAQLAMAAEEFRKDLTENPVNSDNWNILGDILVTLGDLEAAGEAFAKARAVNPAAGNYYDDLVQTLEHDGRYSEAIEMLKKQLQLTEYEKNYERVAGLKKHLEFLKYHKAASKSPSP